MDDRLRALCLDLSKKSSSEAVDWLIKNYPIDSHNYGEAISLIRHKSWKRADQIRLGRYYLRKIPFASAKPYESFLSIMSVETFVSLLNENLPLASDDLDLLIYNLRPALERVVGAVKCQEIIESIASR